MSAVLSPRYISTRNGSCAVSFQEALLSGLAPDGGLYVPDTIPRLEHTEWRQASSFSNLAYRLLRPYLADEVPDSVLKTVTREAFSFPVPLVSLGRDLYVLELFHGPTLSFKDFGARTMARLMDYFLQAATYTILVATSGDTGSAVADGFAGQRRLQVALLFPEDQVSPVQERQLTLVRPGVRAYAVAGTFDDCQHMVKTVLATNYGAQLRLSAANSINVGRLLPQMLYYVWAVQQGGFDTVSFCVPCGNLGNLTGGVLAALAGLPVRHFLAAHNANDGFPRFLAGASPMFSASIRTLSNAMDVGRPSNFERLQYLVPAPTLRDLVSGISVNDEATLGAMRRVCEETGYVADPHTAVALEALCRHRASIQEGGPFVVLSTAHPAKFPEIVERALGCRPEVPERLAVLEGCDTNAHPLAATPAALQEALLAWNER